MHKFVYIIIVLASCTAPKNVSRKNMESGTGKIVIYQVFTRLFGNTNTNNIPWGTIEQNGVGKFNDITATALDAIKAMGVSHIWYTGVPHHAVIRDYSSYGISHDDPDVVKGRAGSPYAVKDYYNVNPDLAVDPANRLHEFKQLINRSHEHGLKVIIDIVPNHVARHYHSVNKPDSVTDFGAEDNTSVAYAKNNNFYYIPGQAFKVPVPKDGYRPLGGEGHPLADGKFEEYPAKWTGNGSREPQPDFYDWYETVKINYGIRPDGTKDFDSLPIDYSHKTVQEHHQFWQGRDIPSSWKKFRDIAFFWLEQGVDGFRFDMAEMVPVEFWSYLNSAIKLRRPSAVLIAEIYNPQQYRNYIQLGKMDFLYDKVDMYDTLRSIIQGNGSTRAITEVQQRHGEIERHMLQFLENHDEHRIASADFARYPEKAKPAMVVASTIGSAPVMLYFGQEVGEPGAFKAGFGGTGRTTIFDYAGVPQHQKWMNNGKFDGGLLSNDEKLLRSFYKDLLNITANSSALQGNFLSLHEYNLGTNSKYQPYLYAYARWKGNDKLIVVCNFSTDHTFNGSVHIPQHALNTIGIRPGAYQLRDLLHNKEESTMQMIDQNATIHLNIKPLESAILAFP